jgi:cytidylate kinase
VRTKLTVVSGLAASGKTTVGRLLSERLSLPLIDKDVILEALFDSLGCDDRYQRYRLSRASDDVLYALAESSKLRRRGSRLAAVTRATWISSDHERTTRRGSGGCARLTKARCG